MRNDKGIGAGAAAVAVAVLALLGAYFLRPVAPPAAVVLIKAPAAGGMFISRGSNPQIYFARQLLGDQLDSLSVTELEQLEQQLDSSVKQIRSRKNQHMINSISELQRKEKSLTDQNRALQEVMEAEKKKASVTQATKT